MLFWHARELLRERRLRALLEASPPWLTAEIKAVRDAFAEEWRKKGASEEAIRMALKLADAWFMSIASKAGVPPEAEERLLKIYLNALAKVAANWIQAYFEAG